MEDDLVCNFKKCRKRINGVAWVTSCSHIFCEEDGSREFSKQQICPACETVLSGQLDFIQVDVHPSEQYKSMVLAGQRPEVIMEVCTRAMSFWTYQAHQERAYQEYVATKAVEKAQKQESYYEQLLSVNQSELTAVKSQLFSIKKDIEIVKTKYNEVSEKLTEKSRQYQKLQGMYEALRRKNINPSSLDGDIDKGSPRTHPGALRHCFDLPLVGSVTDRNALPHGLHSKQSVDYFLPSSISSVSEVFNRANKIAGSYNPDPTLAAAVNSAAMQPSYQLQGKTNEKFSIKMSKNKQAESGGKT